MLSTLTGIQVIAGANTNGTMTIQHYASGKTLPQALAGLPVDEGLDNDGHGVRAYRTAVGKTAISHKLAITIAGCSEAKPQLIGLGLLINTPDVSMQDIMDWVTTGRAFSDGFSIGFK
jgi:hypothetical protein